MSEQEDMVHAWTMTLISVLNGLTIAGRGMLCVGQEEEFLKVLMEVMRDMTRSYTPEYRQHLSKQLEFLSGLANRG